MSTAHTAGTMAYLRIALVALLLLAVALYVLRRSAEDDPAEELRRLRPPRPLFGVTAE